MSDTQPRVSAELIVHPQARNLYDNVLNVVKLLPSPRRGATNGAVTPGGPITPFSPGGMGVTSPYDPGQQSPFNPASKMPFPVPSRFGAAQTNGQLANTSSIERQTCLL